MKESLEKPFKSKAKNKKLSVYVKDKNGKNKIIHFGDTRYEHYFDKTGIYQHLNHKDVKRKKNYYSRHGKTNDKLSAKYWSNKYLW